MLLRTISLAAVVTTAIALPIAPASAKEIERQQIGQFAATDRAPRTRTECIDRESVVLASGEKSRLCTEWRTEAQIYYRRSYLVLDGPAKSPKADRRPVEACMQQAAAAAQTDRAEEGTARLLPSARLAFTQCLARAKVGNPVDFTLTIDERADWSGWR
ncbi:MAG: hypothetical protein WA908_03920 [Pontixanthobacter sp.]